MAWAPLKYGTPLPPQPSPDTPGLGGEANGGQERTKSLLGACEKVVDATAALVEFVDKNRRLARQIGVETIAIQLAGIVDGGRLGEMRAVLAQSVKQGLPLAVSPDVEDRLRRGEALLADASAEIAKETGVKNTSLGGKTEAQLGADEGVGYFWVPFVVLGLAATGVVIYAYTAPKAKKTTPLPQASPKIGSKVFLGSSLRKTSGKR